MSERAVLGRAGVGGTRGGWERCGQMGVVQQGGLGQSLTFTGQPLLPLPSSAWHAFPLSLS